MITEWLISLFSSALEWFSSILPTDEAPEFITSIPGFIGDLVASTAGLGAWVPWAYLGLLASLLLGLWVVLVGIKGVRWVWGLTPFSGGS